MALLEPLLIWPFDFRASACRTTGIMHCISIKFGVDRSRRFSFRARTHTDKVTDATDYPTHALLTTHTAGVGNNIRSCSEKQPSSASAMANIAVELKRCNFWEPDPVFHPFSVGRFEFQSPAVASWHSTTPTRTPTPTSSSTSSRGCRCRCRGMRPRCRMLTVLTLYSL